MKTVICDLDNTLVDLNGRDYRDYARIPFDMLDENLAGVVNALKALGYAVEFLTGREEQSRFETQAWLKRHGYTEPVWMRSNGDTRTNDEYKRSMLQTHLSDREIALAIDDNPLALGVYKEFGIPTLTK